MVAIIITIVVLGAVLRFRMDRAAENRLYPGEDIAIADLRAPLPENAFLACPPNHCAITTALPSPSFAVGADRLYEAWGRVVASEPHTVTVDADEARHRFVAIQHSAVFRFPDIIIAEFVALGPGRSSLAVYSHARYGRSDFGVNRRRVEAWLAKLRQLVPPEPAQ
jgi:uncharacterized protein (DUF1499 family)